MQPSWKVLTDPQYRIMVRKKCVRCPWALQFERSVYYFCDFFIFFHIRVTDFSPEGVLLGSLRIFGFQPPKNPPCIRLYLTGQRGRFSKVVLGFWNFVYDFCVVGGDVWRWLCRQVCRKFLLVLMGVWVEGRMCNEPGARTPIGATEIARST
jgi:hypothetical protein